MKNTDAFFEAIKAGDAERIRSFVREKKDLLRSRSASGVSPVLLAMYHQQEAVLDELLRHDPVLDVFEAAALGRTVRVTDLVDERPEQLNEYSGDGFTPLGLSAFFGRRETLDFLVSRGADVNAASRNEMHVRPLHSAVACRIPDAALAMARTLLANGAEVNAAQQGGWTPLHQAAAHGHVELVKLLLHYGADPGKGSEEGITPVDIAEKNGHSAVAELLGAAPRRE